MAEQSSLSRAARTGKHNRGKAPGGFLHHVEALGFDLIGSLWILPVLLKLFLIQFKLAHDFLNFLIIESSGILEKLRADFIELSLFLGRKGRGSSLTSIFMVSQREVLVNDLDLLRIGLKRLLE